MWYITWGYRIILLNVGSGTFKCPKSRNVQGFRHKRNQRFFTVYGLPVFPSEITSDYLQCNHCGEEFGVNLLNAPDTTYRHNYAYLRVFAGTAIGILVIISIFLVAVLAFSTH